MLQGREIFSTQDRGVQHTLPPGKVFKWSYSSSGTWAPFSETCEEIQGNPRTKTIKLDKTGISEIIQFTVFIDVCSIFSLQNISEIEIIDTQLKSARMHSMSRSRSRGEDRVQQLKWHGVTEAHPATWPRPKNLRKNPKDHLSQWISDHQKDPKPSEAQV